jgi:hypothetical protein
MGIGCISPDPVTQASKKQNSSGTAVAQDQWWLNNNAGSRTLIWWLETKSILCSSITELLLALRMGHRLHQPGPCYSSFQKQNSSGTAVAQDQWWLKINDGSRTMLAQEPARALLLEAKAQAHWFNQRWFTNLTAQETGWLKNKTGSIAMIAQKQWWLHFDRLQANKYTPQSWSVNVQLQGQWYRPARCFRSWLFYTLLSETACTFEPFLMLHMT